MREESRTGTSTLIFLSACSELTIFYAGAELVYMLKLEDVSELTPTAIAVQVRTLTIVLNMCGKYFCKCQCF